MAGPANLYRRPSGIYCARLVVPERLRAVVGKAEMHASTGSRTLAVAKAVAAAVLANWREHLLSLDQMDINQIKLGSPALAGDGFLTLASAASASGFTADELLQKALERRLRLYTRFAAYLGHLVPREAFLSDPEAFRGPFRPMPIDSEEHWATGMWSPLDPVELAGMLLSQPSSTAQAFEKRLGDPFVFVAAEPVEVTRDSLLLPAPHVESLRAVAAASLTKEQIKAAKAPPMPRAAKGTTGRLSTFLDPYMVERSADVKADEAKRIRALLQLFIDMMGDPHFPDEVNNALLADFENNKLALVPHHEEKVRLKLGTRSVQESIAALRGTNYKRLTPGSIAKRMVWLAAFIAWVKSRGELRLTGRSAKRSKMDKPSDARDKFSDEDLTKLFSAPFFAAGRGKQTKAGRFHTFKPWHYWGPLIALHSGMRPNEQCQMLLGDIIEVDGRWWFDIAEDDSEDEEGDPQTGKSLKNLSSRRRIPVHPLLVRLGLIDYRDKLQQAGRTRLFEEWSPHANHGRHSPKASEWFNGTFRKDRLGADVSAKKTLYSFRHNLATALRESGCSDRIAQTLMGHSQGDGELKTRYDKPHESAQLLPAIDGLDFKLPTIAPFDIEAGVQAVADANRRTVNKSQGSARAKALRAGGHL